MDNSKLIELIIDQYKVDLGMVLTTMGIVIGNVWIELNPRKSSQWMKLYGFWRNIPENLQGKLLRTLPGESAEDFKKLINIIRAGVEVLGEDALHRMTDQNDMMNEILATNAEALFMARNEVDGSPGNQANRMMWKAIEDYLQDIGYSKGDEKRFGALVDSISARTGFKFYKPSGSYLGEFMGNSEEYEIPTLDEAGGLDSAEKSAVEFALQTELQTLTNRVNNEAFQKAWVSNFRSVFNGSWFKPEGKEKMLNAFSKTISAFYESTMSDDVESRRNDANLLVRFLHFMNHVMMFADDLTERSTIKKILSTNNLDIHNQEANLAGLFEHEMEQMFHTVSFLIMRGDPAKTEPEFAKLMDRLRGYINAHPAALNKVESFFKRSIDPKIALLGYLPNVAHVLDKSVVLELYKRAYNIDLSKKTLALAELVKPYYASQDFVNAMFDFLDYNDAETVQKVILAMYGLVSKKNAPKTKVLSDIVYVITKAYGAPLPKFIQAIEAGGDPKLKAIANELTSL